MTDTSALGLFSYNHPKPTPKSFMRFYDLAIDTFKSNNIPPTNIAIEGNSYSGNVRKFDGKEHKKLLASDFEIDAITLISSPPSSENPGFDYQMSISLSHTPESSETILSFAIDSDILPANSDAYMTLLDRLLSLHHWDFGFTLTEDKKNCSELHILALSSEHLTEDEQNRIQDWYDAPPTERVEKIRDVYEINISNDTQLDQKINNSITLREFIEKSEFCKIWKSKVNDLWIWTVNSSELPVAKLSISGSQASIT